MPRRSTVATLTRDCRGCGAGLTGSAGGGRANSAFRLRRRLKTSVWEQNFGAWAGAIRRHGDRQLPHLSEQSFLNLLYFKQTVDLCRWQPQLIRHRDWDTAAGACLFHFPCSRREHMHRYRLVGKGTADDSPQLTAKVSA